MKKSLLVTALVVGFSGAVQAETSVTLYGLIDAGVGYERQKADTAVVGYDGATGDYAYSTVSGKRTKTGLRSGGRSGNRWGLKGVEDLGNGLRAIFQIEGGFNSTTGVSGQSGRLFGRRATLGLANDSWGQLNFGRQTNVASQYVPGIVDPFTGNFGMARMGAAFGATGTVRYDNMILYQTPNISGFQFGVGYTFNSSGEQEWRVKGSDDPNIRAFTTAARYTSGPIGVALSYDAKKNSSNRGNADATVSQWNLGAAYDFGVVKVSAGFGQARNGRFGPVYGWNGGAVRSQALQDIYDGLNPDSAVDQARMQDIDNALAAARLGLDEFDKGFKSNSFLVGLRAPVAAGTVMVSWHMADPRSNPDRLDSDAWDMKKQHTYNLGYIYPISKRTDVYAHGTYAQNQSFIDGSDTTIVGIGMRHSF